MSGIIEETEACECIIDFIVKERFLEIQSEGEEPHEMIGELTDLFVILLTGGCKVRGVLGPDFVANREVEVETFLLILDGTAFFEGSCDIFGSLAHVPESKGRGTFLFDGKGRVEERGGLGLDLVEEGEGDAVVLDHEESDGFACLTDLGCYFCWIGSVQVGADVNHWNGR